MEQQFFNERIARDWKKVYTLNGCRSFGARFPDINESGKKQYETIDMEKEIGK